MLGPIIPKKNKYVQIFFSTFTLQNIEMKFKKMTELQLTTVLVVSMRHTGTYVSFRK